MSSTNLPLMTEDRWARMGWSARQQWLRASLNLMRQVRDELDALSRDERSRVAHTLGIQVDRERLVESDAHLGPGRLDALDAARWRMTTHCRNGHERNEMNTYWRTSGHPKCRPCDADRARIRKAAA